MAAEDALKLLGELPAGVILNQAPNAGSDIVLLFADDLAAVNERVVTAHGKVAPGGRLWVAYRKGGTRKGQSPDVLHRDTLQQALAQHGLTGVTLIAIDDTWSAMRVRPI